MENASKALLIAAAIIIAVVLISLGVMVLSNGSNLVRQQSDTSELDMTAHNSKFQKYEGNNIRGAQINSLLSEVVSNNIANTDDVSKQVSVTVTATDWQTSGTKPTGVIVNSNYSKALTGKTYNVSFTQDTKTGFITAITIANSN